MFFKDSSCSERGVENPLFSDKNTIHFEYLVCNPFPILALKLNTCEGVKVPRRA